MQIEESKNISQAPGQRDAFEFKSLPANAETFPSFFDKTVNERFFKW